MKQVFLYTFGILNLLHGISHFVQFFQSVLLAVHSFDAGSGGWFQQMMNSPWMGFVWSFIGIFTLYTGYGDYKQHRKKQLLNIPEDKND